MSDEQEVILIGLSSIEWPMNISISVSNHHTFCKSSCSFNAVRAQLWLLYTHLQLFGWLRVKVQATNNTIITIYCSWYCRNNVIKNDNINNRNCYRYLSKEHQIIILCLSDNYFSKCVIVKL